MGFSVGLKNEVRVFTIIFLSSASLLHGFNLETRLPLIKIGHNGSYFGYSVAAHQIFQENANQSEGILLVGAPLDQNLQPNTTQSGALWRCPLTNYPYDCSQVITDGRRNQTNPILYHKHIDDKDLWAPLSSERKNGQWMGVTLKSQGPGKKVLVCAHRYMDAAYNGPGLCYILEQDLEFNKVSEPCSGDTVIKTHEDRGFCQTGTGGTISEDDYVVVGSPGALNWHGEITVLNVQDDYLRRDKTVYTGIDNESVEKQRIKKYSYLGMSVTTGNFYGNNSTVYVAGAPRSNEIGQVVLFVMNRSTVGRTDSNLKIRLIISGEQIGSGFGYQVTTADLNGDSLPDLIIAAPFYFNAKTEEGGAVYIYMNDPKSYLNNAVPVRLTGKNESRFGFAITSLGDLNHDEFDDIAVGAPYEGNGVVYIYLGSKNGLITKPSQIIKAQTLRTQIPISTFGYSLSGGVDLDANGYPDLLIGAYEKDAVVLLRARPIIGLTTFIRPEYNLTNIDPNVRNCLINNTNYISCFSFDSCFKINSLVKTKSNRELLIKYHLEAETFEKERSRIWFDDFTNKNHTIIKILNVTNSNSEFCQRHAAYLKENTLDIQSPIKIKILYELIDQEPKQTNGRELLALDNYPILNQQQANKIYEATFLKDCGSDDICASELIVSTNFSLDSIEHEPRFYQLVLGERKNLVLNVNITNAGESAYQAQLFVRFPKQISFNKLSADDKNSYICRTKDLFVSCMLGNPLKQNRNVNLTLEFDATKVDDSEKSLNFNVTVNTTSNDSNKAKNEELEFKILVVDKIQLSLTGYSTPEEIPEMVNIQLKGESAIKYKEEIGHKVTHYYSVVNSGTWTTRNLKIEIEWPYQVANNRPEGKWLLYLDEYPIVEGNRGKCDISLSDINPLKLLDKKPEPPRNYTSDEIISRAAGEKSELPDKVDLSSDARLNRIKRSDEMIVMAETYTTKEGKKRVVHMNCVLNTTKCHKILCYLEPIESRQYAQIIIKSRLWDATLIEDYADVDVIKIASRAKIHIPPTPVTLPNQWSNEFQITTVARLNLRGQKGATDIPIIFIIAAILIGLLLFILLTLLLWKLGFFKRRRPDPTLSGNLEKHRLDDS